MGDGLAGRPVDPRRTPEGYETRMLLPAMQVQPARTRASSAAARADASRTLP